VLNVGCSLFGINIEHSTLNVEIEMKTLTPTPLPEYRARGKKRIA
jgi:hypothetical protein